ncbi:MAG: hypothetical protein ACYDA2_06820 [Acidimicrobiales bacterium]
MVVVDVLLACNLVLFAVCAYRAPHRAPRPGIDALVAEARSGRPPVVVPVVPAGDAVVVPFCTRGELAMRRAKALHPSSGHPAAGAHF